MQQRKLFGSSAYSIQRRRPRLSFRWNFTRLPPRNRSEKAEHLAPKIASIPRAFGYAANSLRTAAAEFPTLSTIC